MRLTTDHVAEIKSAEGVYRASDVARAYDIHRSTVTRIWAGRIHQDVSPEKEPPNISTKARPSDYLDDIRLLINRGMTVEQVADYFGISVRSVYQARGVFL